MRVLHLINSLATGGAEKLIIDTLPLYSECGLKVDLLLLNGTEYPFYKELISKKCCRIFSLGKGSVYNPLHLFRIIPFLKKYDLVHVHLFPSQYFVVLAKIVSGSKIKLIFTEHSTSNRRIRGNFLIRYIDVFFYRQYHKIICITDKVQDVLQNYTNIESTKFQIIENGVDLRKISNAIPLDKSALLKSYNEHDHFLIQVSSFQEPKDQKTLIRAMAILPEYFKLFLVGIGPLKLDCEKLVKKLGLENKVYFLRSRMDVPQLLKTVDIVVLSSNYEGLSLSSIEGMASGRPFVASDVPGLKQIVGGAGILFPVGDHKKLADEILELSINTEYYQTTVDNCQKRAAQYNIQKMVDQHIALYREVAQK